MSLDRTLSCGQLIIPALAQAINVNFPLKYSEQQQQKKIQQMNETSHNYGTDLCG